MSTIVYVISLAIFAIAAFGICASIKSHYETALEHADDKIDSLTALKDDLWVCKEKLVKKYDELLAEKRELHEQNEALSLNIKALEHAIETDKTTIESKNRTIDKLNKERGEIIDRMHDIREKGEQFERDLWDANGKICIMEKEKETLYEIIKSLQPEEKTKGVKCEKGEWCKSCEFNKSYPSLKLNICLKNCSCNGYVTKEEI